MNICLYGASSPEIDPVYLDAAYAFGRLLAQHGHTLVYGGGAQGVMGAAARGAYEAGGKITGIAPTFLQVDGILFDHCTEFLLTDTMAERKTAMIARADAFVMAPGGFGTLEEFFEVLTLKQLGRHNPAIAVLNTGGFYDSLQSCVRSAVERRFIRPAGLQGKGILKACCGKADMIQVQACVYDGNPGTRTGITGCIGRRATNLLR